MACWIFLNFMVPIVEDISKDILKTINMDNYRIEKQTVVKIQLPDSDARVKLFSTMQGFSLFNFY